MKTTVPSRYNRRFTIRFTEAEFEQISNKFKNTTCHKLSDYMRIMILSKPLKVTYRNQSADDFLAGMLGLKNELSAIGNNYQKRAYVLPGRGVDEYIPPNERHFESIFNLNNLH